MGLSTHTCLWRDEAPNDGAAALGSAVVPAQRGRVRKVIICSSAVEVFTGCARFGYGRATSKARASLPSLALLRLQQWVLLGWWLIQGWFLALALRELQHGDAIYHAVRLLSPPYLLPPAVSEGFLG